MHRASLQTVMRLKINGRRIAYAKQKWL